MFGAGGGGQTVGALNPDYGTEIVFYGQQGPRIYLGIVLNKGVTDPSRGSGK